MLIFRRLGSLRYWQILPCVPKSKIFLAKKEKLFIFAVLIWKRPVIISQQEKNTSKIYCGVEQLVARRAHNPKAVSSSLAPATKSRVKNRAKAAFFILLFTSFSFCFSLYYRLRFSLFVLIPSFVPHSPLLYSSSVQANGLSSREIFIEKGFIHLERKPRWSQ